MAVARPGPLILAAAVAAVALAAARVRAPLERLTAGVRQLRWFFLVIAVFYGWWTPGTLLVPALGPASPTLAGMAEAGQRITALILLVIAVQLLFITTPRGVLVGALHWWLRPLGWLGLDADRFALRLVLVLELVPALRQQLRDARERVRGAGLRRQVIGLAAGVFEELVQAVERAPFTPVRVPQLPPVPARAWLPPAVALMAGATAGFL